MMTIFPATITVEVPDPTPNRVGAFLQWDVDQQWLDWFGTVQDPAKKATALVLASTTVTPGIYTADNGVVSLTTPMPGTSSDLLGYQCVSGLLFTTAELDQADGTLFVVTCDRSGVPVLTFPAA